MLNETLKFKAYISNKLQGYYPQAGDAVKLTDTWDWAGDLIKVDKIGIINGLCGDLEAHLQVIWNYSAFRGFNAFGAVNWEPDNIDSPYVQQARARSREFVSVSGGPGTIALPARLLVPTFETVPVRFWCWRELPKGDGGVDYTLDVPLWEWDGKGYD
jgi:hypothetical protein